MPKTQNLNIISAIIVLIVLFYTFALLNDYSFTWSIPEGFIFAIPVMFVVSLILSVISVRKQKSAFGITLLAVSVVLFIITLLSVSYVFILGSNWTN